MHRNLLITVTAVISVFLGGLTLELTSASAIVKTSIDETAKTYGLLFVSFGDAESCACVESYVPNALAELANFEIPTPKALRKYVGELIWKAGKKDTMAMYEAISPTCNTSFQTNARAQAEATLKAFRGYHESAEVFVGYNFIYGNGCPSNVTVVDQARLALASGVTDLVVVNQNNAQESNTSIGVAYEQLRSEITKNEWSDVNVWGLDDYSAVPGFNGLLETFTQTQIDAMLPDVRPSDVCLLFACHGNPSRIGKEGDPGEALMRQNYAYLSDVFEKKGFDVYLAFQNHGGKGTTFPQDLFAWSSPPDTVVVPQIAEANCTHVFISGAISFVVDNSETLFDERIDDRRMLGDKPAAVSPMFNDDDEFASFLAKVIADALAGQGPRPLRDLKKY